ncbi:UMP-CMP kinase 2, mitochondrial isoform X2 [Engraulis encrasicolus]|uniref:UMP-CMP kinase 2, mitochondrial isoform X2 n=1 Tax=Engraulis encrasicolus TaxID=184585 RepID=UPI002FD1443B
MMARRLIPNLGQWSSRIFEVECGKRSALYFALRADRQADPRRHELKQLFGDGKALSFHVQCGDRIQRSKMYAFLQDKLSSIPSTDCTIMEMPSFLPDVKQSVRKGFLLMYRSDSPIADRVIGDLQQVESLAVCSYVQEKDIWWQNHLPKKDGCSLTDLDKYCVTLTVAPEVCPTVLSIINNDVFYSFDEAYKVLTECRDIIPESQAVLDLVDQRLDSTERGRFPVIVIEGLDATGKTTLTESLARQLNAVLLKSPPESLAPLRARFDAEPPLIRRAFYALGNYITAGQIARDSSKAPVVVDRYWHSTAAYAIATAVRGGGGGVGVGRLPGAGSEVYRWPQDLLRPSLVLLLTLDPAERQRRLRGRGLAQTPEEAALEANNTFRQNVSVNIWK